MYLRFLLALCLEGPVSTPALIAHRSKGDQQGPSLHSFLLQPSGTYTYTVDELIPSLSLDGNGLGGNGGAKNIDIDFAYKSNSGFLSIFKGDSDQDRPNI